MKKKTPTLKISTSDPKAKEIWEFICSNKDNLDYSLSGKTMKVKKITDEGEKILAQIMKMSSDYSLN